MTEIICKNTRCINNMEQRCQRTAIVLGYLHYPEGAIVECISVEYRRYETTSNSNFATKITDLWPSK